MSDEAKYSIGFALQGHTNTTFGDVAYGEIDRGEWLDLEFLYEANTVGSDNGVFRIFVNGTERVTRTNVRFFEAVSTSPFFSNPFCDPTYGGGNRPPATTVHWDVAAWYTEVAP